MRLLNIKVAVFLTLITLGNSNAVAAPIFELSSGGLAVTGLFAGGPPTLDIRGAVSFLVSDIALPPSLLAIYDSTGGTDPDALVLAFGNSLLFADNGAGLIATVTFDFALASAIGSRLTIPGTVAVGPGATGSLAAFAGASPVVFGFTQTGFADLGSAQILQWQLTDVGIPEPATYGLFGAGLTILAMARRKYRQ